MGRGTACYTPPMDALALYQQGRYAEALGLAQAQGEPKAAALALLALGEGVEAQTLLEAWSPADEAEQAERLALLGFTAFRKGNSLIYRRLAIAAAQSAQTPLYTTWVYPSRPGMACWPCRKPFTNWKPRAPQPKGSTATQSPRPAPFWKTVGPPWRQSGPRKPCGR